MGAKNKVVEGEYKGKSIISSLGNVSIVIGFTKSFPLDSTTIAAYELLSGDKKVSATSAVGRGALGGFLLGPVGLLAAASAKKKGVYLIAVNFKDGNSSLLEVDEKIYQALLKKLAFIKNNNDNSNDNSNERNNVAANDSDNNILNQIKQLAELKDQGILTEEEFSKKKVELLAKL